MTKSKKIFFVMAGGGHETDRHYYDTIKNRRPVGEFSRYLKNEEADKLKKYAYGRAVCSLGCCTRSK